MSEALRKNDIKVLTEIEHCLKRPNVWIGSTKEEPIDTYVYDENGKIHLQTVNQIPGLLKIFDEVISNSVDEAIRTNFEFGNRIDVYIEGDSIRIRDNGRGLPIELDKGSGKWTPEIIVTQLRAGSNFDDTTISEVVGQNGVGVSLSNIYSEKFSVKTSNGAKSYVQSFKNNLSVIGKPKIGDSNGNYTEIAFSPSYEFFNISAKGKEHLIILFEKRVRDLAFAYPEIKFYFNKKRVMGENLKKFLSNIHEVFEFSETPKARLGVFYSDTEFQQISFVNGADTRRAGSHIDLVTHAITEYLREYIKKKFKFEVKPIDIRSKLFIVAAIRISRPKFDSQTKERLMTPTIEIKELVDELITDKFLKSLQKNEEIIGPIVEAYKLKQQVKDNLELKDKQKKMKKVKITKLVDATAKNRDKCTLYIVEGDSAGATFLSVRNEYCGALKLKGKIPNITGMKPSEIVSNTELSNIMASIGLEIGKKPENLRFGKIAMMTDADVDGNHITGLLMNFFHRFWPDLFNQGKIIKIMSPLYIAYKGKTANRFYSFEEWNAWKKNQNLADFKVKYFKGLGGLGDKEYELLLIDPVYSVMVSNEMTSTSLDIAFGEVADKRKVWMSI